ncbi:MAG TPA: copper resistance protein NlpE [Candidatus Sulfotelmatobacter sp.]|nr:copper resistance protein NlpE [Candidatus Sulfotelmatobacter sp.]
MIFRRQLLATMVLTSFCAANAVVSVASQQAQDAAQQQKASVASHGKLVASYHGVLPCADCPGIDTTVRLFAATDGQKTHGLYTIKHTYQERKSSYTENGTWTLEKGTPDDTSASVFVLKPKTSSGVTNFLRVGDDEIRQLDNDRKPFSGSANFSLKRVGK